jgi:myosin heavy subunit
VSEDTSNALTNLDHGLDEQDNTPMIDPDTGIVLDDTAHNVSHVSSDDGFDDEEDDDEKELTLGEILRVLLDFDETFTTPLDTTTAHVQTFSNSFDIDTRTQEISNLLQNTADTPNPLQMAFSRLTAQVTYQDFWKRYFYRCHDETRRMEFYTTVYKQHLANQKWKQNMSFGTSNNNSNSNRLGGGLEGVTNFLGGAVKAMTEESQVQQTAAGALSFFGAVAGGPMYQTTESGDDEEYTNEEEEEEEELGWDDDDDVQDDDLEDSQDEPQIEFKYKDAEKERLQEELAHAMAERDVLSQTVQTQTHELTAFKEAAQIVLDPSSSGDNNNTQNQQLQMQLFEKDSELAALKARLEDNDEENDEDAVAADSPKKETKQTRDAAKIAEDAATIAEQERDMARLVLKLADKGTQLLELQEELQTTRKELVDANAKQQSVAAAESTTAQQSSSAAAAAAEMLKDMEELEKELEQATADAQTANESLEKALKVQSELEGEVQSLRLTVTTLESKNTELEQTIIANASKVAAQEAETAKAVQAAQAVLQAQLSQLGSDLEASNQITTDLTAEVASTKQALEKREAELANMHAQAQAPGSPGCSTSSPGSMSTGIKVPLEGTSTDGALTDSAMSNPGEVHTVVTKQNDDGDDDDDDDDDESDSSW